ncbi:MAG TPA: hypothetical protein VJQ52_04220 [Steroidobacteraceae bacterium]|nr:hypothetical protein [Steroidobacteraceae bacterium]
MNRKWLILFALCSTGTALAAEEPGVVISVGARAWYTQWTTFSYFVDEATQQNLALTQVSADDKLAVMPLVSVRYDKWLASASALPSTDFTFPNGKGTREELDVNVGYFVVPSLAVTLGYKHVSQSDGPNRYRPAGPVLGLSANAPLAGLWSMYGSLGAGWLKTPGGDAIDFEADYRLAELGLAYALDGNSMPRRWTFTGGYRIQVVSSHDAFDSQDGRDTTQGFTLGVMASF